MPPNQDTTARSAPAPRPPRNWRWVLGAIAALVPLALVAGLALQTTLETHLAADDDRLRENARSLAAAVDAQFGTYAAALRTLTFAPYVDDPENRALFEQRARRIGPAIGGWIVVTSPPPEARMLVNTLRPPGTALPEASSPELRAALAATLVRVFGERLPAVTDLFTGPLLRRWVIWLTVPVEREGQVVRGLSLGFEPSSLNRVLQQQGLAEGSIAVIVDGQSRMVARSGDPEGRFVGQPAPSWIAGAVAGHQRALAVGPHQDGTPSVYAFERLATAPGWVVAVARPLAEQRANAWLAMRWLVIGAGALVLGIAALSLVSRHEALRAAQRETMALRAGRAEMARLHASLPAIIFLREIGPDGGHRLLYRGGDFEAVTGWPAAELEKFDNLDELASAESRQLIQQNYAVGLRQGFGSTEWQMRQPDGSWQWMRTTGRVLERLQDGRVLAVGYIANIQSEREAMERAEAAGQELDRTLAGAPLAVYRMRISPDFKGRLTYLSRGVERLTGWPSDLLSQPGEMRAIMAPEALSTQPGRFETLVREGASQSEFRLRRPDGSWVQVRQTSTVLQRLPDGEVEAVGYLVDISAEHEARDREEAARRELELVLSELPAIAYRGRLSPQGAYRQSFISQAAARVTGLPIESFARAEGWAERLPEEYRPHLPPFRQRVLDAGEAVIEYPFHRLDGSLLWLRDRMRLVRREVDGGAEVIGTITNITEERRMVTALLDTGRHAADPEAATASRDVELMLAYVPAVLYINRIGPDGKATRIFLSRSAEAVTGWPWSRLDEPGQLAALTAEEDVPRRQEFFRQVVREGEGMFEYRMRRPDGGWRWCRTIGHAIRREVDGATVMVGCVVDITTERAAEVRALASARLASLGEMAAGLAHELKQPLQVISLAAENAQFVARHLGNPEMDSRLETVVEQAQRAGEVIEHLRRFARGTEEGAPPQPLPLDQVVQGALALIGHGLRDAAIEVQIALGKPVPRVLVHPVALEQVLTNLMLNARDALLPLPVDRPRYIRLGASSGSGGDIVRLTVADNGGGIAPDVMARLFEPFVTTKGPDKGTGLGLSICHGLVGAMGGHIEAHNGAEGAVFTITLPAA